MDLSIKICTVPLTPETVSYTHLDVYKRQHQGFPDEHAVHADLFKPHDVFSGLYAAFRHKQDVSGDKASQAHRVFKVHLKGRKIPVVYRCV